MKYLIKMLMFSALAVVVAGTAFAGGSHESGNGDTETAGASGAGSAGSSVPVSRRQTDIPTRDSETMWRTDRDFSGAAYLTLGGGCFWCIEAVYDHVPGVIDAVSGYAGGMRLNPTYQEVVTGTTGHAEVVRVAYDPAVTDIEALLDVFWKAHNPTTLNRQGADVGTQYRSIVLVDEGSQLDVVRDSREAIDASGYYDDPSVTEIQVLQTFYPAEEYHQDYFAKNPDAGYCRVVIAPKLDDLGEEGIIGID